MHEIKLPALAAQHVNLIWAVMVSAVVGLLYGAYLVLRVLRADPGSKEMQQVSSAIQEGARAYLLRQFRVMIFFVVAIAVALLVAYWPIYGQRLAVGIALAFVLGCFASGSAGYVGMSLAVRANVRVAAAALKSFKSALELAFQAGTISGMFTVGMGLLGATIIFLVYRSDAMKVLVGFGFGGCLVALFMRVGGGIYTKAADVGADLVGKVEKGIPEDDPRNAATIADNVGDNVGDCAGMAADVFESYEVTLVAAIILAAAALTDQKLIAAVGAADVGPFVLKLIIYALLVRAVGVFSSMLGTWSVRAKDEAVGDPMKPINVGFWTSAIASVVGFGIISYFWLGTTPGVEWYRFFAATFCGILLALAISALTSYFTHTDRAPVTEIAYSTRTGPATMILQGVAYGLESSVWGILSIAVTIVISMLLFPGSAGLAAFAIALTGLGLLTTTGYILAMDTYGPISDNANGIFEMSETEIPEDSPAGKIVHRLDAVGNVTKALTKGFAIATAVIAAVSLFRSFIDSVEGLKHISIDIPRVFVGLLVGGAVPFLFSSMAIRAVSRAAFLVVEEVRRQFREIPGIMEKVNRPDYSRCVGISTAAAQKELIGPGVLAICTPILVNFALGPSALGGYLAGAILTGQLMAVFLANSGGAWDNAKKKIEAGLLGGKGSECHKAAVIGDTVGDPFKDTAGPALNPMIKVMNLVGILIAPVVVSGWTAKFIIGIVAVLLLAGAVAFSKRGAIASEVGEAKEVPAAAGSD